MKSVKCMANGINNLSFSGLMEQSQNIPLHPTVDTDAIKSGMQ